MQGFLVKKLLLCVFLCGGLLISPLVSAQPTIEEVTISPEEPWARSTITFTVTISSETPISDVYLIVRECKDDMCFAGAFNVSMDAVEPNTYQTSVTLIHQDATFIEYVTIIHSDETWTSSDIEIITLSEEPSNGENGDNGNGDPQNGNGGTNGGQTPGFEFLFMIGALVIVSLLLRKRCR